MEGPVPQFENRQNGSYTLPYTLSLSKRTSRLEKHVKAFIVPVHVSYLIHLHFGVALPQSTPMLRSTSNLFNLLSHSSPLLNNRL